MKQSVPATPLMLVGLAIAAIAASAWGLTQPVSMTIEAPAGATEMSERATNSSTVQLSSMPAASASMRDIQGRSPFVEDRSAYSRVIARPRPAAPTYQPELVGIFGKGDNRSAMIIWKPGDPATSHDVGSTTPWGTIQTMTSGVVQFANGDEVKTLRLFE